MTEVARAGAFAFVTDGAPAQQLGIALVLRDLARVVPGAPISVRVYVAAPRTAWTRLRALALAAWPGLALDLMPAKVSPTDRYYVQLSLRDIFDRCNPADRVLCLDYDHLIRTRPVWPVLDGDGIFVSSEVRPVEATTNQLFRHAVELAGLNASLLAGRVHVLSRIASAWDPAYEEARPLVPTRFRTEIALGLAALRAHVTVKRCEPTLQSSFAHYDPNWALFHYGGESEGSASMKRLLASLAVELWDRAIDSSALETASARMHAHLETLLGARTRTAP